MSEPEHLSRRGFAELVGMSPAWISQLARDGKLPIIDDGRHGVIPREEGLRAFAASQEVGRSATRAANAERWGRENTGALPADASIADVGEAYNRAKAEEKIAQARRRQLEVEQLEGSLVEVAAVESSARGCASVLTSILSSLPSRAAGRVTGLTAGQAEAVIREEVNEVLEEIQRWATSVVEECGGKS